MQCQDPYVILNRQLSVHLKFKLLSFLRERQENATVRCNVTSAHTRTPLRRVPSHNSSSTTRWRDPTSWDASCRWRSWTENLPTWKSSFLSWPTPTYKPFRPTVISAYSVTLVVHWGWSSDAPFSPSSRFFSYSSVSVRILLHPGISHICSDRQRNPPGSRENVKSVKTLIELKAL